MSECQKEEVLEQTGPIFDPPVYIQRYTTVRDILYKLPGIEKVVDFGCAEGKFIKYLKKLPFVTEIACVDIHKPSLESASNCSRPVAWDFVFKRHKNLSVKLFNGSVTEKDCRLRGCSAVTCIELLEHLELKDLPLLTSNVFGFVHPKVAIFTTPNCEFNVLFPQLKGFRHWDHKFEWNRKEFRSWCEGIIREYPDYNYEIQGVGEPPSESKHLGYCSQLAVFKLKFSIQDSLNDVSCCEKPYILVDENKYPGRSDVSEEAFLSENS